MKTGEESAKNPRRNAGRRWLVGVSAGLIMGAVGLNVLAYRHAYAMMHFADGGNRTVSPETLGFRAKVRTLLLGVNVPRPVTDLGPEAVGENCRPFTIECENGITLGAWYGGAGEGTPLVVLFHGYSAEKACLRSEAAAFLELGVSVLLVDFRGVGESSESYTTIGFHEAEDVVAVVRFAEEELSHPLLVLFGQSMGGVAILRAIREHELEPDAVIVEAVFDRMLNTVRNRFAAMGVPSFPSAELLVFWGGRQAGFNGFRHNPVDYAGAVTCPVLFMHGTTDPRARVEEGRRVFDAAVAAKVRTFREFASVGHGSYAARFPGEWRDTVGEFLRDAGVLK